MARIHRITPCLWFDHQAEDAARFYCSVFPRSAVTQISRYGAAGQEIHGRAPGSVMVVAFELDGVGFTALNGGPHFRFTEAISLQVNCDTQQEIDHYWAHLTDGGDPAAQQCGWLKDRFGLSWQVVPAQLGTWMTDPDPRRSDRVMSAVLQMKKIDLATLQHAFDGTAAALGVGAE